MQGRNRHGLDQSEARADAGFTLIELVVVVFIIGILMAIAIPAFISTESSSRSAAAESDISNAISSEQVYWLRYGAYGTTTSTPTMASFEPGLGWQACGTSPCVSDAGGNKDVYIKAVTSTLSTPGILLGDAGTDGKYYWGFVDQTDGTVEYLVKTTSATPAVSAFPATNTTWKASGG